MADRDRDLPLSRVEQVLPVRALDGARGVARTARGASSAMARWGPYAALARWGREPALRRTVAMLDIRPPAVAPDDERSVALVVVGGHHAGRLACTSGHARLETVAVPEGDAVVAAACAATSADVVCIVRDGVEPVGDGWLVPLLAALGGPVGAAAPQLVDAALTGGPRRVTHGLVFD